MTIIFSQIYHIIMILLKKIQLLLTKILEQIFKKLDHSCLKLYSNWANLRGELLLIYYQEEKDKKKKREEKAG